MTMLCSNEVVCPVDLCERTVLKKSRLLSAMGMDPASAAGVRVFAFLSILGSLFWVTLFCFFCAGFRVTKSRVLRKSIITPRPSSPRP